MLIDKVKSVILPSLPKKRVSPGGWMSLNCPMCVTMGESRPDKRKRGGFNFTADSSIMYHCFNCGYKTGWKPGGILGKKFVSLLTGLGIEDSIVNKLKIESIQERSKEVVYEAPKQLRLDWEEVTLPDGAKKISADTDPDVLSYLQSRGRSIFENWDYYWTPDTYMDLNKRIIVPCFFKDKIVGWVSRHVKPNKTSKPKYYVKVQQNYLFNLDQLYEKDRKYVILVEGPFDAIGVDGVGLLGSSINRTQVEFLNTFDKKIILVPDRDTAGKRLVATAIANKWAVSFPEWDDDIHDVADAVNRYGRLFALKSIIDSMEENPTKINVLKRRV